MRNVALALLLASGMAGCGVGNPPPESAPAEVSPLVVAPPGAKIVPLAVDTRDPKAPRALPADSPLTDVGADEVAKKLPSFPGGRVLEAPSNPGGTSFVVQTTACVPAGARVEGELGRVGWTVLSSEQFGERTSVEAASEKYLLSATVQPGVDARCNRAAGERLVELVLRKRR